MSSADVTSLSIRRCRPNSRQEAVLSCVRPSEGVQRLLPAEGSCRSERALGGASGRTTNGEGRDLGGMGKLSSGLRGLAEMGLVLIDRFSSGSVQNLGFRERFQGKKKLAHVIYLSGDTALSLCRSPFMSSLAPVVK
jgi:hypothetical protein